MGRLRSVFVLGLLAALLACGSKSQLYQGHGLVEEVKPDSFEVVISHDDIEDFMPAMTMNFLVPDPKLLASLAPGQLVDFTLEFTGRAYLVQAVTVVGRASEADGWVELRGGMVRTDPAPGFDLTDQTGRDFALADVAGRVVLIDFIYTNCQGPCPILSRNLVAVQRALPDELRDQTWFVSVSLDPEVDRPEVLREYAERHGMDLANWSLLTGESDAVEAVVRSYGVGSVRAADGVTIDHRVASFLIDAKGRIAKRYMGVDHEPAEIAADVIDLCCS